MVGIGLLVGKQDVDLRVSGRYGIQQPRQRTIGVRPGYDIHLPALQQLVFQTFRHTAHNAHNDPGTGLFLLGEDVYATVDALLGIVAHRTGVGQDDIGLGHFLRAGIAFSGQDRENDFRVIHVHLASVCFDIDFLFHWHGA